MKSKSQQINVTAVWYVVRVGLYSVRYSRLSLALLYYNNNVTQIFTQHHRVELPEEIHRYEKRCTVYIKIRLPFYIDRGFREYIISVARL